MDAVRQGEIALKFVKFYLRKEGLRISPDNLREFGDLAKALGISIGELKEFLKPLFQEILDECFVD